MGPERVPPILTLNRKPSDADGGLFSDHRKKKRTTKTYGFYNLREGDETSARCGKEKCPIEYKIAIMLLHIHKFLLRAYHSMQSTLPCHHGSRGALQQQWEEKTLALFQDEKSFCESMPKRFFFPMQPFVILSVSFMWENYKKF